MKLNLRPLFRVNLPNVLVWLTLALLLAWLVHDIFAVLFWPDFSLSVGVGTTVTYLGALLLSLTYWVASISNLTVGRWWYSVTITAIAAVVCVLLAFEEVRPLATPPDFSYVLATTIIVVWLAAPLVKWRITAPGSTTISNDERS